ncbi:TRAP transporter small permease [Pollutimonas thiosulfatoxidans]|uniref:TRAP transporter small permease protein n=1 Tax=Pollutimonas thiosulfatoxidans TaxID=2028345 RepID=A0A410GD86_9BURK|nr:TRAP transporter small permease [Pollutimonas thiosulfatoxidans]QAA94224.1 hypothetical protein CKA81_10550 [Pollutimonas thiosulfatoxidans]
MITRIFDTLDKILRGIVVGLVLFMLAALALQVAMRYVANSPLAWSEELALLAFSWVVLLSTALGIRNATHARLAVWDNLLPRAIVRLLNGLIALAIAGFGLYLTIGGLDYAQMSLGMTSAAIAYPMVWLNVSAPVCGVLLILFALEQVYMQIGGRATHE